MKLPLRLSLSRPIVLRILLVLGVAALLGYLQFQIYQMNGELSEAANQDTIGALVQRLNGIDDRLDQKAEQKLVSMDDFRASQQALSNRIDGVQAQLKQIQQITQNMPSAATMSDVVALEAKLETLQVALQEVRKANTAPPPAPTPAKSKSTSNPRKAETIAKPAEGPPPFTVIGVEYRGGERFLSVAPPGSTQLSQLNLVRPGDSIAGSNWRLSSLDDTRALFSINGTARTVLLNP